MLEEMKAMLLLTGWIISETDVSIEWNHPDGGIIRYEKQGYVQLDGSPGPKIRLWPGSDYGHTSICFRTFGGFIQRYHDDL